MYCSSNGACSSDVASLACAAGSRVLSASTGCPTDTYCNVGNGGVIHVGDTSVTGGQATAGAIGVPDIPQDPCVLAVYNKANMNMQVTVAGDVYVYGHTFDYPD